MSWDVAEVMEGMTGPALLGVVWVVSKYLGLVQPHKAYWTERLSADSCGA